MGFAHSGLPPRFLDILSCLFVNILQSALANLHILLQYCGGDRVGVKVREKYLIQKSPMIGLPTIIVGYFKTIRTHGFVKYLIFIHKFIKNAWHYNQILTLYPENFTIGNSRPSKMRHYKRFDIVSDDTKRDIYCTENRTSDPSELRPFQIGILFFASPRGDVFLATTQKLIHLI